jgi:glycosyltransferase involved in cell wall biosynthesis
LVGAFGPHDAVVDVRNGIPFFAPVYCRRPVVSLVHHVHREQWRLNFSPRWARFGWWVESRLAPRVYRVRPHVTVSQATRRELAALGIQVDSIEVVLNGADPAREVTSKAPHPTVVTLGRLVPHKRVELALEAIARLRPALPDLRLVVAGQGPWEHRLRAQAARLGIADAVTFTGWVDEQAKRDLLASAWVLALPSVKEGWGLVVMEAAAFRTPTVAFRVGGLEESIAHGQSGLLADDEDELIDALRRTLVDPSLRERLGEEAARRAAAYSWDDTAGQFAAVLREAMLPEPVAVLEAIPVVDP